MIRIVRAIEQEGFDVRTLTLQFDVPSEDFGLIGAIRKAATDFCKTETGRRVYENNCSYFNWADFSASVPQEFCEKYGFKLVNSVVPEIEVNLDEQLVDDTQIEYIEQD